MFAVDFGSMDKKPQNQIKNNKFIFVEERGASLVRRVGVV